MTMLTPGTVATKTTASASSSTTMSSSAKPSSTKARLLFNSDGSVKLMGDIADFPGIGADKNSHTLVPTVGPDGKMTMLLAPSDGRGKTFILNPTNGGSLPSPNVIATPDTLVGNKSTSLLSSSTCHKNVLPAPTQVVSRTPTTQIILSSDQLKPASKSQISLLPSHNGTPVPVSNTQFETHMRIDPSGSVTSTVRIPCSNTNSSTPTTTSVSQSVPGATAVLKQLADKVTTIKKEPEDITCHNDVDGSRSSHPKAKAPGGGLPEGKGWTRLHSVLSTTPPSTVLVPNENPTVVGHKVTSVYPRAYSQRYVIVSLSSTDVIAPPGSQSAPSTVNVFPIVSSASSSSTMTSTAVPTMMFRHNYAASMSDKSTSVAPTIGSNTTQAPQTPDLFKNTAPQKVVYPMNFIKPVKDALNVTAPVKRMPTVVKVPSADQKDGSNQGSLIGESSYIMDAKLGCLTSVAPGTKDPCNKGSLTDGSRLGCLARVAPGTKDVCNKDSLIGGSLYVLDDKSGCLKSVAPDPKDMCNNGSLTDRSSCVVDTKSECPTGVAPDPIQQDPDDGVLSLKIDSVFSLAVKEEKKIQTRQKRVRNKTTKCTSGDKDDSPKEPEIVIKKETGVEPENRLPTVREPEIVTCPPSYVVLEQLSQKQIEDPKRNIIKCSNYCRLRTLNFLCKLGLVNCEPTVHIQKSVSKCEANEAVNSKHAEMLKNKRKQQSQSDSSLQTKPSTPELPSNPKKKSLAAGDSSKVRKIESAASPKLVQKVIKFTKIDNESSSKSETVSKSATPAPPPAKNPVCSTSVTTKSVIPPSFSNPNTVPLRPLLNMATNTLVLGKSSLRLPCSIASKPPALPDGASATKKQYYLFTVNGQNVLVPVSNDVMKPTAYMLKGNTLSALSSTTTVTANTPTVSNVGPAKNVIFQKVTTLQNPALKRPTSTVPQHTPPSKVSKVTEEKVKKDKPDQDLPAGIRIKPEPVTHGYGDEKPVESTPKKTMKDHEVKIKQEPVNDEWQEVWSSKVVPVQSPETAPSLKKQSPTSTTVPKDGPGDSRGEDNDTMPTLPMMQLPSAKDRVHKMAAHNDRVERLKAVLKQKEKEIEDLKKKRMEGGAAVGDSSYGVQDTYYDKCTAEDGELGLPLNDEPVS
ncbi:mucin-17-like isoform X2 [Haliotis asinina]